MLTKQDIEKYQMRVLKISKKNRLFPNENWQMFIVQKICDLLQAHEKGNWVQTLYVQEKFNSMKKEKRDFNLTFSYYVKDSVQDIFAHIFIILIEIYNQYNLPIAQLSLDENREVKEILAFPEYCQFLILQIINKKNIQTNISDTINALLNICNLLKIDVLKFIEYRLEYHENNINKKILV